MQTSFLGLDEARELLRTFRTKHMTHEEGAAAGLLNALKESRISVGIVEDCVNKQTYRKALKAWIKTAATSIVEASTKLEIACVGTSNNYLVCYDTTLTSEGKEKQVRCVLCEEGDAYQLHVDTAFFDGGNVW